GEERALREEAVRQRADAEKAREQALINEQSMRHLYYLARIRQVQAAWEAADVDRAEQLLAFRVPSGAREDLRGWEWYFLKGLCQGRFTLRGHEGRVNAVAYRPDGRRLATAGYDQQIRIWDTRTGALLQPLLGHEGEVWALAYRPEGRLLVSAGEDHTLRVWDVDGRRLVRILKGHAGSVRAVAIRPDGQRLASAGEDRTVRIWDVESGKELLKLEGHEGPVNGVAYPADGQLGAPASRDRTVRLWDGVNKTALRTLRGHDGEVLCVVFRPDGKTLASGGGIWNKRGELRVWDPATGDLLRNHYWPASRIQS